MKHCLLLLTASIILAIPAPAKGKIHVPAAAKQNFTKEYPAATKVKWEREKGNYEVNFTQKDKKISVVYDENGTMLETETPMNVSLLPANAVEYIKQHYKSSIKDVARITKANGEILFEAEVSKTAVIFDSNGKFLRTEKD